MDGVTEPSSPTPPDAPEAAARIFGDHLDLAVRYAGWLADAGVVRGLIGPREVDRLWDRHILNSAVIGEVIDEGARVVDIGSGAGLPGIPLAIARPDLRVQLVEPLLRRATFLSEVVEDLGLDNVEVHRGRAEEKSIVTAVGGADVVTSRAVAPVGRLMGWSLPLARKGGFVRALKGSSVAEEFQRDAVEIRKAGGSEGRVLTVGDGVLDQPTFVAEVERLR
ncbi:16S rRNA (guanine(527)-N(7))-methyltransferase RsmG [Corynebacterium variabile]|uniref:16S rRNA (guanine(527)-N(7))-methyltransferase RsmG n=1 Tax=Corynebacterium variabile TaxID=1727 RepID=UPI002649D83D|nr:16S rRNA (guanine(527)-N(7))-methyltransferase RsmG [Corynebacterium variabile]MDN6240123.1 16S rRNA (guanine(527)-N(7))-methyltransferase RsmG [Corynebacterium variabile]MDN6476422.1 16S rRNA (guanine(527)-N(7))-methyltransferase RsmG [Corynebacterium variabile]MDN6675411.1 16S rRNA (guanine(527)-N(7))-methyltransferase RsmG [Corynebacterium variabile]MDN6843623.1 16S rRNA (guanine(527)-N(7))-methyltransferase RsmG [Corynebacterium variabile]